MLLGYEGLMKKTKTKLSAGQYCKSRGIAISTISEMVNKPERTLTNWYNENIDLLDRVIDGCLLKLGVLLLKKVRDQDSKPAILPKRITTQWINRTFDLDLLHDALSKIQDTLYDLVENSKDVEHLKTTDRWIKLDDKKCLLLSKIGRLESESD